MEIKVEGNIDLKTADLIDLTKWYHEIIAELKRRDSIVGKALLLPIEKEPTTSLFQLNPSAKIVMIVALLESMEDMDLARASRKAEEVFRTRYMRANDQHQKNAMMSAAESPIVSL